ncbi:hypothetical protein [Thermincola potens]|uniref:hypothetical protein n=1 Tax=Thermincola potens TaxID=863643 RepID=UPI0012FD3F8E|nr:hypothetical protein [Thermincola potens]
MKQPLTCGCRCTGETTVVLWKAAAPVKQPLLRGYGQSRCKLRSVEITEPGQIVIRDSWPGFRQLTEKKQDISPAI